MSHYVAPNHQFVLLKNNSARAMYSAQHRGRVESRKNREANLNPEDTFTIMTKEAYFEYGSEMVEIEFIAQHSPERDENGKPIISKTKISRSALGTCCDPSTDAYWSM